VPIKEVDGRPVNSGRTRAAFAATAGINRSDFGVSFNGPVPGGGVAVSERVQIQLDVEAVLQEPQAR
jgi:polyisoprenoid-binding protein YceI